MWKALATVAVLLAACGGASTAPTPTPTSTPTPTPAQTTPTATPTPSQTPVGGCSPTSGGTAERARITDMRIGTTSGYDTLVIQFDSTVTHYELSQNPTGMTFAGGGGKGGSFTLAGAFGLRLNIFNLDWTVPPGNQYRHGTDLRQSAPELQEVHQIGDFEGVVNIAIGLRRVICPEISILSGPPRLVLQFPAA
jgi:opacity protein-like surface antigen